MSTSLTKQLALKRMRIKDLEKEREDLIEDRKKFREDYVKLLKWALEASGKGTSMDTQSMILSLSKLMNRVKPWYWS